MKHAIFVACALSLAACDQVKRIEDDGGGGSSSAVPPAVQQRLTQSCAISGCHVSGATTPDLSEASGGAWVEQSGGGGPFITFGDVENSYLIQKMLPNPSAGSQMPLPPGELSPEDLSVVIGWVWGVEFPNDGETADETDTGSTTDETTGAPGETSDSSTDLVLCSIEVIDGSVSNPVDAGDDAGKIPSSVGAALERNCGCHYASTAESPYLAFGSGTPMQTLEDFTNPYAGGNEAYMGSPGWMAVQDRVIEQGSMPTATCETEDGGVITDEDFALFEAWFNQEAPDGASFEFGG